MNNIKRLICLYCILLSSQAAFAQGDKDLGLDIIQKGDKWQLYVKNIRPVTQEIVIKKASDESWQLAFILTPSEDTTLLWLEGKSRLAVAKAFNEEYDIRNYFGDPAQIKPNLQYLYTLPFKKHKKYEVGQGYFGKASHNSTSSRYAIDFTMNIGEPVYAARGGLVVKTISHYSKSGGKAYVQKANKIIILHEDGTTASYAHLNYQGVLVAVGDTVNQGQHIGYSGNTGNSRGPHLHFVVRKERDISIPTLFEGYKGKELKQGRRYWRK